VDIKVDVDAEAVNQMVAQAILDSAIGTRIKQAADKVAREYSLSWQNHIRDAVRREVDRHIRDFVSGEFGPLIKEKVREYLTDEVAAELIDKAWAAWRDRY